VGEWLGHYKAVVPEAYKRAGVRLVLVAQNVIGNSTHVLTMLGYDSLAHRDQTRAVFEQDAEFRQFLKDTTGMVLSVENRIMRTTDFSPLN
ncbi:MAG: NIPSNAP family protein, partial [Chloroflexota bacterium]